MFFLNTFLKFATMIYDYIDTEINDENKLQQQLFEVRLKYEMDEIDETEYESMQNQLIQRIREIKQRKLDEEQEM